MKNRNTPSLREQVLNFADTMPDVGDHHMPDLHSLSLWDIYKSVNCWACWWG